MKGVSSRKVELEEVIEPSLQSMASSAAPEVIPELASPAEEGTNDNDHETLKESTTEPRRSSRTRAAPELYGNPIMNFMVDEIDDPATYEEAIMSLDSNKWLEAMKSEMESMYENQVLELGGLTSRPKGRGE